MVSILNGDPVVFEMLCPDCEKEDDGNEVALMTAGYCNGSVFFLCVKHDDVPVCCVAMDDLVFWKDDCEKYGFFTRPGTRLQ